MNQSWSRTELTVPVTRGKWLRFGFDVACAGLGLLLLSPVMLAVGVAIKLDDGGPVFYTQERKGKDCRSFRLIKFRSMIPGADHSGGLTRPADARVTRVGRVLRRHKLDELPQLFNILHGEMQLVGSRPELAHFVRQFPREYGLLLQDRPGITDPAALAYACEEELLDAADIEKQYVSHVLPEKLKLSLEYQQSRTFASDVRVLFQTVVSLLKH